jgi:phycoerythrin-associated linker protein
MVSTFINPQVNADPDRQNQFYQAYQPFKETAPIELSPGCSDGEADVVIRAVYRQVMGNAHVMESERSTVAESQLKRGELSVREFVRRLAKSAFYRSRFFESCDRYRSIELNYKHLLGRAPDNFDEMRYHSSILDESGFEADIDTYVDSDEYQAAFGESIVPYYRGYRTQAGQSMLEFTNMLQLLRSASSSDRNLATNNKPQLTRAIIQNSPYGKQKISDGSAILAELFKRQVSEIPIIPAWNPTQNFAAEEALRQTDRGQAQTIERLEKQLADLRPFAAIGSSYLSNNVQSASESASTGLKRSVDSQTAQIAKLQEQIADAQRYATIGEARANKWRSRVFNG